MQQLCAPIVRSHFRIWHEAEGHGAAQIASENGGLTAVGEQPSGQHANYEITLTLVAFGKLSVGTYMTSTVLPFHMASKNKLGDVDKSALTTIHRYGKFAESGSPRSHEELDETRVRSASACDNRQNLSGGHSLPRTHPLPRSSPPNSYPWRPNLSGYSCRASTASAANCRSPRSAVAQGWRGTGRWIATTKIGHG